MTIILDIINHVAPYWLIMLCLLLCTFYLTRRRSDKFPPGPTGLPLIGYIPFLGAYPPRTYLKLAEKYGPILSINIGPKSWVILNDYDSVHEALVKHGDAFSGRPQLDLLNTLTKGYGIIFRDFDENLKEQRRFALTTLRGFGVGKRSMEDSITEELEYFTDLVESKNGASFDCRNALATSVSNVTCSIVMGSRFSYDDEIFNKMVAVLNSAFGDKKEALLVVMITFISALRHIPPFSGAYKRTVDNVSFVLDSLQDILDEHKRTIDSKNIRDFIDAYLIQMQSKNEGNSSFTEIQLLHTIRDFFLAGTETTSSTLRWCILCFAHFPEVQQKIANEIKEIIGDAVPSMKHKDEMPYISSFIHEITRHKTLLPIAVPHTTNSVVKIRDFVIPKNTPVLPNLYAANHDPKYFVDPNEFKPERFINEDGKFVPDKHVIPFSVGPRYCLGEQLAKMELFLFLTNIVKRFEIVPDPQKPLPSFDCAISGFVETAHQFDVSFKARR